MEIIILVDAVSPALSHHQSRHAGAAACADVNVQVVAAYELDLHTCLFTDQQRFLDHDLCVGHLPSEGKADYFFLLHVLIPFSVFDFLYYISGRISPPDDPYPKQREKLFFWRFTGKYKKECKNEVLIFALFTKLYSFFYFKPSNELYKKAGYFPTLPKHF